MKTTMFVVGTRPEIIKTAPVIAEMKRRKLDYVVVGSGQHWSDLMFAKIAADIGMDCPDVDLQLGKRDNIPQIALCMNRLAVEVEKYPPDIIVAQGDTNTMLAACLTANKMLIPFAHIESGVRSFDWRAMEEQNRVIADHASRWLFAPTTTAMSNLVNEGISNHVFLTGCTVVDALLSVQTESISVPEEDYCLATIHRRENTDYPERIVPQLLALNKINHRLPVIFPVHPRTRRLAERYCKFDWFPPMGYVEFLAYQKNARVIVTDSGGVQEEASIFGVPCVTLMDSTPWPETVEAGVNELVPPDKEKVFGAVMKSLQWEMVPMNLFGDGNAAQRIVDILEAV